MKWDPSSYTKLLYTQGRRSYQLRALQQQHRLRVGFSLFPSHGEGPLTKESQR